MSQDPYTYNGREKGKQTTISMKQIRSNDDSPPDSRRLLEINKNKVANTSSRKKININTASKSNWRNNPAQINSADGMIEEVENNQVKGSIQINNEAISKPNS